MGFLSQTVKTESAFESFYGTNLAGSEVATSEMNEDEVYEYFVLPGRYFLMLLNADEPVECVPLH
jgi:hypothetical protein